MINVLYVFRRKRTERFALYKQGLGPDEMLYGMNHLDQAQFTVSFIEGEVGQITPLKRLTQRMEQTITKGVGMGFALDMMLENLPRLKNAGVIVSTVDSCGLPIAFLKQLGVIDAPVIYFSQGLSDRVESLEGKPLLHRFYKTIYSWLLRSCETLATLGEGAARHLSNTLDLRGKEVRAVPFGVDMEFWRPADANAPIGDYILSVGSDSARDYDTLVRAIGDRKLKIVTRLPVNIIDPSARIEVRSDYSDVELRALYQGARFMVTPLKDATQPSGQSATLQAMACGKAVIITCTRGLWEPQYIKHLESAYLVDAGDADSLTRAIRGLDENPALVEKLGRASLSLVKSRYNSIRFGNFIQAIIHTICQPLTL